MTGLSSFTKGQKCQMKRMEVWFETTLASLEVKYGEDYSDSIEQDMGSQIWE